MFPVPTVADMAVISAWKWLISPLPPASRRLTNASQSACGSRRNCRPRSRTVNHTPVPINSTISGQPQTNPASVFKKDAQGTLMFHAP